MTMIPGGLTERHLKELRETPKTIMSKVPVRGLREESGHRRCNLTLHAPTDSTVRFEVFIRQTLRYIENFSLGLIYHPRDKGHGAITLVRYNGAHGEQMLTPDGHYAQPHIHYLTAEELARGYLQPRALRRVLTDRFSTLEDAIPVFLQDIGVSNVNTYFEDLMQGKLFNGC